MNQNNNTNSSNREVSKLITLTAFMIGYILIDNLNSNEQGALGNFFMLVGQTLCTSGSENFKRDWAPISNPTNTMSNSQNGSTSNMTREQMVDMLNRARDVFSQEIDKLN